MKQTLNSVNSIINFMYFANNFSMDQLKEMLSTTSAPGHILDKFNTYCDRRKNGTEGLFDLFMQLSSDNQKAICKWVNENYLAFKHLAEKPE